MVNGRGSPAVGPRARLYGSGSPVPYRREPIVKAGEGPASETKLTVLLAHPHRFIRESIASYLHRSGTLVREASIAPMALRLAQELSPNIMVMDCEFPEFCEEIFESITELSPGIKTAVLASSRSPYIIAHLVRLGAMNWVSPDLSGEEFVNALRMIARGDVIVSREVTEYLERGLTKSPAGQPLDALSQRERQVLTMLGQGATNNEIAEALTVTERPSQKTRSRFTPATFLTNLTFETGSR